MASLTFEALAAAFGELDETEAECLHAASNRSGLEMCIFEEVQFAVFTHAHARTLEALSAKPAKPATESAAQPAAAPAAEPAVEPAAEPAAEPVTEPAAEPAVKPATEPAA
ncbi:hypothetical protein T492DRAFT_900152 [Pavlovales sp. CCMP2436]|nr:hypothetical protein T492DRAFT_900152 [Pavlovales sp. CCMP2436]